MEIPLISDTRSLIQDLRNVVPLLEKNRSYRGRGGELIREACCRLISSLCNAHSWIPFKQNTPQRYYQTIVEGLRNFADHVQVSQCRERLLNVEYNSYFSASFGESMPISRHLQ